MQIRALSVLPAGKTPPVPIEQRVGEPHSPSEGFTEEIKPLLQPGIETRFTRC